MTVRELLDTVTNLIMDNPEIEEDTKVKGYYDAGWGRGTISFNWDKEDNEVQVWIE